MGFGATTHVRARMRGNGFSRRTRGGARARMGPRAQTQRAAGPGTDNNGSRAARLHPPHGPGTTRDRRRPSPRLGRL